ncbi:MAG TPA: ATP synthase subunit C [Bacillota bacterium]|nr:ATP synthase subunit C [Bacillota bacterium]
MKTLFFFLLTVFPILAIGSVAFYSYRKKVQGKSMKKILLVNLMLFLAILAIASLLTFNVSAAEAENNEAQAEQTATTDNSKGLGLLAAAISTGLAGIGGGIAVAAGAPAAIAATSEDPKAFGKALIFVALGESIALYGVVISILIMNNI